MSLSHILTAAVLCSISRLASSSNSSQPAQILDPAVFYNMVELVCSEGYHIQEHTVVTEDGYVLTVHRIPSGKRRPKIPRKTTHYQRLHKGYHPDFENCVRESREETSTGPPVLISHGLFVASDSWVLQGPHYDLAYKLLDEGYDVWFTNIRGNYYSRNHVTMSPSDPAFWDFSFHEFGLYDVPATIDYIINVTGYPKIFYVGHSMGTTMFFILMSTRPEYNDKIQFFAGMAPVAQLKRENFEGPRASAAKAVFIFLRTFRNQGVGEFMPRNAVQALAAKTFCGKNSPFQNLCYDLVFAVVGYHSKLYLRKIFPLIVSHSFSGASLKTLLHFQQTLDTPDFRWYDYGPDENFRRYGQAEPPGYDLSRVTVPVALYYSYDDYVVHPKDAESFLSLLPNVIDVSPLGKYSHTDFVWAYNAKDLVYNKIIALINKYRNE